MGGRGEVIVFTEGSILGRAFCLERSVKFYTWYSTTGGVGGRSESHIWGPRRLLLRPSPRIACCHCGWCFYYA